MFNNYLFFWFVGKKSDDPLSPDYIPSIFVHVQSPLKRKKHRDLDAFKRRKEMEIKRTGNEELTASSSATTNATNEAPQEVVQTPTFQHCGGTDCTSYINALNSECQSLRDNLVRSNKELQSIRMDMDSFRNDDNRVKQLTGIPTSAKLFVLYFAIESFLKDKSNIEPFKQFIMALLRLRFNIPLAYLAATFHVSLSTCSRLFNHTIHVMYKRLYPALVIWPERDELLQTMPMCFRNSQYSKTTCIIDCFEIGIERPGNLKARAQTYSNYKSRNTAKFLIGITPQGTVSFISEGWGGRTSDKFLTENSGFLDKIMPTDLILADRGFDIVETVGLAQGELKIPAFTKGKKQLSPVEIESTRRLAAVRIHVERVIGTVRQKYPIMNSCIPISLVKDSCLGDLTALDKIVKVCCALNNVCASIIPAD